MRQATSVLIGPDDKIELGDGWGGVTDCVQVITQGNAALSLRFIDDDSLDGLISVLSALSLDRRMRHFGEAAFEAVRVSEEYE